MEQSTGTNLQPQEGKQAAPIPQVRVTVSLPEPVVRYMRKGASEMGMTLEDFISHEVQRQVLDVLCDVRAIEVLDWPGFFPGLYQARRNWEERENSLPSNADTEPREA